MKLYKDEFLAEEIQTLDLGIVQAGESQKFDFYVYNDSLAIIKNLNFSINHKEIIIIDAPKELMPKKSAKLIIEWSPEITLREGLKTQLSIAGLELWG